jgi:hypothetical protein
MLHGELVIPPRLARVRSQYLILKSHDGVLTNHIFILMVTLIDSE